MEIIFAAHNQRFEISIYCKPLQIMNLKIQIHKSDTENWKTNAFDFMSNSFMWLKYIVNLALALTKWTFICVAKVRSAKKLVQVPTRKHEKK